MTCSARVTVLCAVLGRTGTGNAGTGNCGVIRSFGGVRFSRVGALCLLFLKYASKRAPAIVRNGLAGRGGRAVVVLIFAVNEGLQ